MYLGEALIALLFAWFRGIGTRPRRVPRRPIPVEALFSGELDELRKESPGSSATQIRNALQFSANPSLFRDNSGPIDRGKGFLDVPAALAALNGGGVSNSLPDIDRPRHGHGHDDDDDADDLGKGGRSVTRNVMDAGFEPVRFVRDRFTRRVSNLKPGEVAQFFVPSDPFTTRLTLQITAITPELPPAQQNQLFGDDIFYAIVDAPTSIGLDRTTQVPFTAVDVTEVVDNPQTGLVRVALQGDWTNAGRISATVTITRERNLGVVPSAVGSIEQDDVLPFDVDVPAGAASAVFEVAWLQNWSRYPTNDIDLILIAPDGSQVNRGATINSPERVVITNPTPGRWTAVLVGFEIHRRNGKPEDPSKENGRKDVFSLTATADGVRLKVRR